jgi:predicted RNase H-like nuclease
MTIIAGVDGCRSGWIAVFADSENFADAHARLFPRFAALLDNGAARIAVDIPIGLPEFATREARGCDRALRAVLGARQSSVFAVPARAAVMQSDYAAACETAFALSDPPRRVSKQCFQLFPKIREVDAALTSEAQTRVFECHPEGAFWALNGGPLMHPKKVRSRPWPDGMAQRRALLLKAQYSEAFLASKPPPGAGEDDFLDACACAWTAARHARGEAIRFPGEPQTDGRGLRMEIWA